MNYFVMYIKYECIHIHANIYIYIHMHLFIYIRIVYKNTRLAFNFWWETVILRVLVQECVLCVCFEKCPVLSFPFFSFCGFLPFSSDMYGYGQWLFYGLLWHLPTAFAYVLWLSLSNKLSCSSISVPSFPFRIITKVGPKHRQGSPVSKVWWLG